MKNNNQTYDINLIDFAAAYPETPACIDRAISLAAEDIRFYESRKKKRISAFACAAAAIMMIAGASAFMFSGTNGNNSDLIAPPVLSEKELQMDMEKQVFASKDDPYYHTDMNCVLAGKNSVGIPLITAMEFDKIACPECETEHSME